MPTLERSNPLPLYYQLKELLKQQILAGHLAPHTAIPSEPELIASYHVSRATVRQALAELVHEGLLYREHGRGTFVCEPRVQQQATSTLSSFSAGLRRLGKRPGGVLLLSELVRGSEHVREQLALADSEQAICLRRLRKADDVLVAYEVDYLPYPRAAAIYERAGELAEGSLYGLMAAEGLSPSIAEQVVKAGLATAQEAELLQMEVGEPGLRLLTRTFDQTGMPIALSEMFYPGSRYEFQVTLRVGK